MLFRSDRDRVIAHQCEQLALRGGDVLDRTEILEVRRTHVGHEPDVGIHQLRQVRDLTGGAHRDLEHDHLDIVLDDERCLRLRDPRRFGAALWTRHDPLQHPLLRDLGPEPLGPEFDADWLHRLSRGRRVAVKPFLMNSQVVAGIGNIYASEALFLAGIHPARAAGRISLARYERLAGAVRTVLQDAIAAGGTTLRDFVDSAGNPGYFSQRLRVYGRQGASCERCGSAVRSRVIGQRSTFYCPRCQR